MPPVEDHPVHPSTVQKIDARYGCHNRGAYSAGYFAPDRSYRPDGTFYVILKRIPHVMSNECQYSKTGYQLVFNGGDPMCEGCTWKR